MRAIAAGDRRGWGEPATSANTVEPQVSSSTLTPTPFHTRPSNSNGFVSAIDTPLGDVRRSNTPELTLATDQVADEAWTRALSCVPYISSWRLFYATILKRGIDIVLASIMLVIALPILLAASMWITVDSRGNPLFFQKRVGRGGQIFTLLKLRTMTPSSSDRLVWLTDENGSVRHKVQNDPRVTRSGRWLRRTSIDELPQLWNVLRGDMGMIGPRPELPEIVARYESWQHARHSVRPGLTGWWQVSGRSDKPMHEHTELDIYYLENMSFGFDCKIAIKTVRVVVRGFGAF